MALLCLLPTAMEGLWPLCALMLSALSMLLAFRLPWKPLFKYLSGMHLFLIPCFLILPFSTPGTTLFEWGRFSASQEGFQFAASLYLRAVAIACFALGIILTTPIDVLVHAAERLHFPRVLAQIALLCYRFLFAFRADLYRTKVALKTRGFHEASRMHTFRTLAHTTGGLLIRALDRTERVTHAMRCRGYRGSMPTLRTFQLHRTDLLAAAACIVFCGLFLVWEYLL